MNDKWWTWRWDHRETQQCFIKYDNVVRWRRGWFTLYKHVKDDFVEWRLYFPFNLSLGIQLGK